MLDISSSSTSMYCRDDESDEIVVTHASRRKSDILNVVITDGSSDITLDLIYGIFSDDTFGPDQSVFLRIYEFPARAVFLESVAIELSLGSPNRLHGKIRHLSHFLAKNQHLSLIVPADVAYDSDASVAFKNADVVICIGPAREYVFQKEEYKGPFFREFVEVCKSYGEFIEKYAKKDVKIIALGNTSATIISRFATTTPRENITSLSLFNWRIAAAHISAQASCQPRHVKNIIVWGPNNKYCFTDCRYMYLANGQPVTDELMLWLRNELPSIIEASLHKPRYVTSMAYALAEHCKILWNGTPENEWTCMGVMSDHSYGIPAGMFFSYPVFCRDKKYEIVQGLYGNEYVGRYLLDLSRLMMKDVQAALNLCAV
ncbi:LOW QUALITY PROTEIN: malate dehydrogenase, cytoplasmic [Lasioglossum baleicum]|uniref:LOW QUALITY PROTEIN: malate dehydrogenase, cytoplasmic n=1 Tax=Lasioglossum baleicum TaxID=434251 RepID=UPI003FCE2312